MMCKHDYTGFRAVMCCIDCGKTEREIVYEQQLTAARDELAAEKAGRELDGTAAAKLLAELQRYRSLSASSSAQRGPAGEVTRHDPNLRTM